MLRQQQSQESQPRQPAETLPPAENAKRIPQQHHEPAVWQRQFCGCHCGPVGRVPHQIHRQPGSGRRHDQPAALGQRDRFLGRSIEERHSQNSHRSHGGWHHRDSHSRQPDRASREAPGLFLRQLLFSISSPSRTAEPATHNRKKLVVSNPRSPRARLFPSLPPDRSSNSRIPDQCGAWPVAAETAHTKGLILLPRSRRHLRRLGGHTKPVNNTSAGSTTRTASRSSRLVN